MRMLSHLPLGHPSGLMPSMRLAAALLLTAACSSTSSSTPTAATRSSCGPTPDPISSRACFGDFADRVQTTDPHGPNYVPPGCPCADYVLMPEPDGGWTVGGSIPRDN